MNNQFPNIPDITIEQAREANKDSESRRKKFVKRAEDLRFWKPVISDKAPVYQAKIRILPAGPSWLKNPTIPWAIEQQTHYIKEPAYNMSLITKCRKTLGEKEKCPICEQNWAIWHKAKAIGDKDLMNKMNDRGNKLSFIGNILVIDDRNNPQFNGEVKLWNHTRNIHNTLQAPLTVTDEETEGSDGFLQVEKKEHFNPYHPVYGRDFIVIAKKDADPKKKTVDYSKCRWYEKGSSPLAPTEEEIIAILERCYDLKEFIMDVPSNEELITKFQQFNEKLNDLKATTPGVNLNNYVAGATAVQESAPTSSNAKQGDSKAYFNQAPASAPVPPSTPSAPKVDPLEEVSLTGSDPTETSSSGEDEDLPF